MPQDDNGPDLFDSMLDKVPGGSYIKSFLGFMGEHKALTAGTIAGIFDLAIGDGVKGSVFGAGAAGMLEKQGVPTWLSVLGGAMMGGFSSGHGMLMDLVGLAVLGVAVHFVEKAFGHGGPSPSPAAAPAQ